MSATIAIVGCLDTKGEEAAFLREVIENTGNRAWVIDTGVLEPPAFEPDTSREAVAEAGGASLVELLEKKDRGFAMTVMSAGAAAITVSCQSRHLRPQPRISSSLHNSPLSRSANPGRSGGPLPPG